MNRTLPRLPASGTGARIRSTRPKKSTGLSARARPLLFTAARCLVRLAIGFVSALGIFGDGRAPFGVAFAAAGAETLAGIFGVLGAAVGSFLLYRLTDGLKYTASTLLAAVAVFAAGDTDIGRSRWFRPLCAAGSLGIVGGVTLLGDGGGLEGAVMLLCEMTLSAGLCAAWGLLLRGKKEERSLPRQTAAAAAGAVLLLGLSRFLLPGGFSPARMVALALTLYVGFANGYGPGAAAGLVLGTASAGTAGGFGILCAFGGLGAGLLRELGRSWSAAAFLLAVTGAALLGGPRPVALYESALITGLFVLLPQRWLPLLHQEQPADRVAAQALRSLRRRQSELRLAVGELGAVIGGDKATPPDRDLSVVFDRAAGRVCRRCALRSLCWDRDRKNTTAALAALGEKLQKQGSLSPGDFPPVLAARCLAADSFLAAANEEMRMWQRDRISDARLAAERRAVAQECTALAGLLELTPAALTPAPEAEMKLRRLLRSKGMEGSCEAWRLPSGRLTAELHGRGLSRLAAEPDLLSEAVGLPLAAPELQRELGSDHLTLRQREPWTATLGVSCRRRTASPRSGDRGTWFHTPSGTLALLLSDGMGSGGEAAGASQAAVRILERFLRAEVAPEGAISAMSTALLLRGGGSASADVCLVDLFRGRGELFKCGAGPTYLCEPEKITRVCGENLPGGLLPGTEVSKKEFSLSQLQCIVLVTDGVSDGADDQWLLDLLHEHAASEPKTLAAKITDAAWERTGGSDDMTAVCISLARTE